MKYVVSFCGHYFMKFTVNILKVIKAQVGRKVMGQIWGKLSSLTKRTCEIIHLFFIDFRSDGDVYSFCSGDCGSESHSDLQHQLSSDQQHKLHLVLERSTSNAARGPKQTPGSRPSQHAACRGLLLHCQISERHQIARRDSYSAE